MRQQATLTTRPDKTVHALPDLTTRWGDQAAALLNTDPTRWVATLLTGQSRVTPEAVVDVAAVAARVVTVVADKRATWHRWNLHAEASRQLMGVRFPTPAVRDTTVAAVVDAAVHTSVPLTPPEPAAVPQALRRSDGTSVLRPRNATLYTSPDLLAAEERLLQRSRSRTGPTLPAHTVHQPHDGGLDLSEDQAAAIGKIGTSGRMVDVLIGPAGAGKTTTMRTLRHAWERIYGPGSVVGLAPSAAAAEVLAADLAISAENTAKWLHDHTARRTALRVGQLVIIDEASLAGTHTLDRITTAAARAGAKVLLVGDWAQLGAVEAGGTLHLLATDRPDTPELTELHRFTQPWQAPATLQLRHGDPTAITAYTQQGHLHDGDTDPMINAAYTAWRTDIEAGKTSLLIAATSDQVTTLNTRARTDRITTGHVDLRGHGDDGQVTHYDGDLI